VTTAGFVVAGGRSERMGRDKALLPWAGATLIDHALSRLTAVCAEVRILCGPEPRYGERGAPVAVDLVSGAGALGGLLTGLSLAGGTPGLFLAVDLPHVPVALLERLVALGADADVVVPISPGGPEPLCALYGPACREPVRRAVERGSLKMTSFWPEVRMRKMSVAELAAFGDPETLFRNVNTPGDYAGARAERG
jgi:molybdopterin-guanine dinucleotide biosynthesis protein A